MDMAKKSRDGKHAIFKQLGIYDRVDFVKLPQTWRIKTESTDLVIPEGYENVMNTLEKEFPEEKGGIKKYFGGMPAAEVVTETFDLEDGQATIARIGRIVTEEGIQIIVASSLGAFHTLALDAAVPKILINPCMSPSLVMDNFMDSPNEALKQLCEEVENHTYARVDEYAKRHTFAAFSTNDELFSFKELFDSLYDPANSLSIPGGKHHLDYPQIALMLDTFVPQCKQDTHAD